jgi:hypothetical protein
MLEAVAETCSRLQVETFLLRHCDAKAKITRYNASNDFTCNGSNYNTKYRFTLHIMTILLMTLLVMAVLMTHNTGDITL